MHRAAYPPTAPTRALVMLGLPPGCMVSPVSWLPPKELMVHRCPETDWKASAYPPVGRAVIAGPVFPARYAPVLVAVPAPVTGQRGSLLPPALKAISYPPVDRAAMAGAVPGATPTPAVTNPTVPSGPSLRGMLSGPAKTTSNSPLVSPATAGLLPAAI